jgi:FAD/FMN-containing dehydrogenase
MKPISRRALLLGSAATGLVRALPVGAQQAVVLDDASRLNAVPVARHWRPAQVTGDAWLGALRRELKAAAADGRPVCVGAARHSMGGQALTRDGVAMTFDVTPDIDGWIEIDKPARAYRVAAGARWRQVVRALDPIGLSPAVMQSNHDFGVAGSLSVNAHGWPVPYGPLGTTVRSFHLMLASGDLVSCSPSENAELFALVMGGYGLLGAIVDVELAAAENTLLRATHDRMAASQVGPWMVTAITQDASVSMAYGRLAVDARRFLQEALLVTLRAVAGTPRPATSGGVIVGLTREILRAQVGSDAAKRARWHAEAGAAPKLSPGTVSRNRLLNEPVASLAGRDRARTDILHEYFLPPGSLDTFLAACRTIIPASRQDLLNVTLRYVESDPLSVLAYAPQPRIGAVMLFSQRMTRADEDDIAAMTRRLIDAALEAGGSFYLPYRLHARRDQIARAYPRLQAFIARKHHYDPGLLFRNTMWDRYGAT